MEQQPHPYHRGRSCRLRVSMLLLLAVYLFPLLTLKAQLLKKVAVLELVNLENDPKLEYLKASLTEAIDTKLQEKFAYERANPEDIKEIAKANHFYFEDFSTKSVAINLGLVANQDVVVSGGFIKYLETTSKNKKTNEAVLAIVRIYDIPQKSVVAEVKETSPLDDSIFEMTERVSSRIAEAARAVLPSKEEFLRSGGSLKRGPWIDNFSFSLGIGGGLYSLDYADRIETQLPALRAALNFHLPLIAQNLTLHLNSLYYQERPITKKNPALEGLNVAITSFMPGGFLGYRFNLKQFALLPRLGGGYVLQQITVTGLRNETLNNSMPFAALALDLAYVINRNLEFMLSIENFVQNQASKNTLGNFAFAGLNLKF